MLLNILNGYFSSSGLIFNVTHTALLSDDVSWFDLRYDFTNSRKSHDSRWTV